MYGLLAMVATLPLAQLFCFHVLLIKKGISTYDYIVALREQEQEATEGQHSPQMSMISSITGLSSASSFNNFQRAAWCTPPRLFVEDQFDAIPPENASVSSLGIRVTTKEEPSKKKNSTPIKISPWALARLNSEDVSRAAAEARKNSKILRPAVRSESTSNLETNGSFGNHRRIPPRLNDDQSKGSKRIHLPIATVDCETNQTFRTNRTIPNMVGNINYSSSPESSLGSPEIRPLRASSSGAEAQKEIPLSRSSSDGYDASGGEDSDDNPMRILHRSVDWSSHIHGADKDKTALPYVPSERRED